jgi:hypothetical protein
MIPVRFSAAGVIRIQQTGKPATAYHFFVVHEWRSGEPVMLGDEHCKLRWFTVEETQVLEPLTMPEYRALIKNLSLCA